MYHPHDEKELNWEPGWVRSGAGVRRSGLSQESSGSSETWWAALLAGVVGDADRLLELSRQAQGELPENSEERQRIVAAAELPGQLLL